MDPREKYRVSHKERTHHQPTSSHCLRRSRSPPRNSKGRSRSPPYYPKNNEALTHCYNERSRYPPRMKESKYPPRRSERSRSPPRLPRSISPRLSMTRSTLPHVWDRRGGEDELSSYNTKTSRVPPLPPPISDFKTFAASSLPDVKFDSLDKCLSLGDANLDQTEQNKLLSPTLLKIDEQGHHTDKQQNNNGSCGVSMSVSQESAFYSFQDTKSSLNKPALEVKKLSNVMDQNSPYLAKKGPQAKVKSLEEVVRMTEAQIRAYHVTKASKRKIILLESQGVPYIQAKHTVIRQNFVRDWNNRLNMKSELASPSKYIELEKNRNEDIKSKETLQISAEKRPELDEIPEKVEEVREEVPIVQDNYPDVRRMVVNERKAIETAILRAVEAVDTNGLQIRFERCQYKSGCLVVTCTDKISADWLRSIVPQLRPWKDAVLRTLTKSPFAQSLKCSVYVPDENGEKLSALKILNRLSVSNKGLNTQNWVVVAINPVVKENAHLWQFAMDVESLEMLQKVNMRPYFGFGSLLFKFKGRVRKGHSRKQSSSLF